MDHVLSTHIFISHRLTTAWLDRIAQAGIGAVETFCALQHLDYHNRAQINELGHWFRDSKMKLHSVHSPMYTDEIWGRSGPQAVLNITEPIKSKRLVVVEEMKRALEIAETVPFRYFIQHLGVHGEEYDERKLDSAFSALEEINLFARQRGVEVLLENTLNRLASAERLIYFLGLTHLKLNFCLDVGHANINEGIPAAFGIMQERIRSTHIHDNDGKSDTHVFPLVDPGTVDWKATMDLLKSRASQYALVLELSETAERPWPQSLETVCEIFDRLEKL
jgi:sugar phosphate isomerase/epimerase